MSQPDTTQFSWKAAAASAVGAWAMMVLLTTPRGDRIMARIDRLLFPPIVTGERRKGK